MNTIIKYKITAKRQLYHLATIPVYTVMSSIIYYILYKNQMPLVIVTAVFIVVLLLHLLIYFNYFLASKNTNLSYDIIRSTFIFETKESKINVLKTSELLKVKTIMSPSIENNNNFRTPWGMYYFSILYFKDRKIVITSLTSDDFLISNLSCEHEKIVSFYPFIW